MGANSPSISEGDNLPSISEGEIYPASPRVKIPPAYPEAKSPPSPLTVSLPVQPNFIKPDYNSNNVDVVAIPSYRFRSHHQQQPLAEQEPHYIASNTSVMAHPPRFSPGTGSRYARATRHLIATEHRRTNHANTVIDTDTGRSLEYRHLIRGPNKDVWTTSLANDLGRLAQGVGTRMPTGTNTVFFIPCSAIPYGRTVTYSRLVASIRSHKTETHRVRVTVGSNRLDFPGDTTTNCASLTTNKCLFNSTISTPVPVYSLWIFFNYNTPMGRYKYIKISLDILPEEIISQ